MANIKSAKKRAKQTVVRNARNSAQRSQLRTAVKKVLKALDANDATGAQEAVYCLLMLENDFIAPSINVETLDPAIHDGEIATRLVEYAGLDTVMTNSFGFGGTNGSMLLSRYNG